jgi:hypothetical protein
LKSALGGVAAEALKGLAGGRCFAPLPEGTSAMRAGEFLAGGLMKRRDGVAWLAAQTEHQTEARLDSTLLFQDSWLKPEHAARHNGSFVDRTAVYQAIGARDIEFKSVDDALREVTSFLCLGFLVNLSVPDSVMRSGAADDRLTSNLAKHVDEIYISAYDQEGWVVWCK